MAHQFSCHTKSDKIHQCMHHIFKHASRSQRISLALQAWCWWRSTTAHHHGLCSPMIPHSHQEPAGRPCPVNQHQIDDAFDKCFYKCFFWRRGSCARLIKRPSLWQLVLQRDRKSKRWGACGLWEKIYMWGYMWVMYVSRLNVCWFFFLIFFSIFFESLSSELIIASAVFGCNQLSFLAHVKHLKSGARKI